MCARLSLVLALMLSLALAGCSQQESEPEPLVSVQTATVRTTSTQQVVSAEAILFPKQQAIITPKITAPVERFYVNRGSRVHRGQLLAVLENHDLSASVEENKGSLEQAQAAYETTTRASLPEDLIKAELDDKAAHESLNAEQKLYDSRKTLFQQGALPRKDLDQAAVSLAQARAQSDVADQHLKALQEIGKQATAKSAAGQLASAQGKYQGAMAQLDYSEIRSPIDGVVTDRPNYPGEMPAPGTPLLTIMDTSSVVARAHIPQDQAALLKPGDAATISSAEAPETPAKVILVSPALDPGSTTVEVWIEAANKSGELRPGATVQVKVVAHVIPNALVIPAAALLQTPEGETSVMVVGKDSRAHKTTVEVGVRNGDLAQISKGLAAGQTVVTTGAYGLPDNTRVKTAASFSQPAPAAGKD